MTQPVLANVLAKILDYKAQEVAHAKATTDMGRLADIMAAQTAPRGFIGAIEAQNGPALIAEIKKASPSKGLIRANFNPAILARAYEDGGANCLSVLTDGPSFQGHDDYLAQARNAVSLPVIRKDFMINVWQLAQSRALGADAILVILAALDDVLAADLVAGAHELGMDVLVETHNEAEMERALALPARLIGVNNRNLHNFETRLETTEQLAAMMPDDRILVAESGIYTHDDLARLAAYGAKAFLVGESLMRQENVTEATKALLAR